MVNSFRRDVIDSRQDVQGVDVSDGSSIVVIVGLDDDGGSGTIAVPSRIEDSVTPNVASWRFVIFAEVNAVQEEGETAGAVVRVCGVGDVGGSEATNDSAASESVNVKAGCGRSEGRLIACEHGGWERDIENTSGSETTVLSRSRRSERSGRRRSCRRCCCSCSGRWKRLCRQRSWGWDRPSLLMSAHSVDSSDTISDGDKGISRVGSRRSLRFEFQACGGNKSTNGKRLEPGDLALSGVACGDIISNHASGDWSVADEALERTSERLDNGGSLGTAANGTVGGCDGIWASETSLTSEGIVGLELTAIAVAERVVALLTENRNGCVVSFIVHFAVTDTQHFGDGVLDASAWRSV